jgi:hypothetical protein
MYCVIVNVFENSSLQNTMPSLAQQAIVAVIFALRRQYVGCRYPAEWQHDQTPCCTAVSATDRYSAVSQRQCAAVLSPCYIAGCRCSVVFAAVRPLYSPLNQNEAVLRPVFVPKFQITNITEHRSVLIFIGFF